MMKKKNFIALVLGLIILGGLFTGMKFYESKISNAISEIIANSDALTVESYTFSLPSCRLIAKNVNYIVKDAGVYNGNYHYEEFDIVFTWGFLMHDGSPGTLPIADNVTMKNSTIKTNTTTNGEIIKSIITSSLSSYSDLEFDISLFNEILQGKNITANWMALAETMKFSLAKDKDVVLALTAEPLGLIKISVGQLEVKDLNGSQLAFFSMNDVAMNHTETKSKKFTPILSIQTLSMTDLTIPSGLLKLFGELETNQMPSKNFESELMLKLANASTPIIKNMTINNAWANIDNVPVKLNSYIFDWNSVSPLQISISGELSVPAEQVGIKFKIALPLLENIALNINTTLNENSQGIIQKVDIVEIKNLGRLEMNTSIVTDKPETKKDSTLAQSFDLISKGKIDNIDIKYIDNGLLSYILLNSRIKNSEQALSLLTFVQLRFRNIKDETMAGLASFIKNPGTLEIDLKLEKPLPYDRFFRSLDQKDIKVNIIPGKKSLNESLDILYNAR